MTEEQLKKRTKDFAHRCVKLSLSISTAVLGNHLAKQLIRCSTSIAANYRSACLAQSKASFIAKISIVLEEAAESAFWLEFIKDEKLANNQSLRMKLTESQHIHCTSCISLIE